MTLSREQKLVLSAVFAVFAAAVGVAFFVGLPAPVDRRLHSEIGKALAAEAEALAKPGGKITVIMRDTETFPQPAMDVVFNSIKRGIRDGIEVSTLVVQVDPLRPANVPPGDFFELLRKSKGEDVVVSLLGPPVLTDQQRFMLGGGRAKVVAFCGGAMSANLNLRSLFEAGLLHAAVVSRQFAAAKTDAVRQVPKDFATLYQIYNGKDLAGPMGSGGSAGL